LTREYYARVAADYIEMGYDGE
jgi:zinc finger protein